MVTRKCNEALARRLEAKARRLEEANRELKRDLAARRRAEEKMRPAASTLRSIMESSTDTILLLDREANIRFINRPAPGVKMEDVVGTSIYGHVAERFRPAMRACFDRVLSAGEPDGYQTDYTTPMGVVLTYEAHVTPVRSDGAITGLAVVARDITERKQVETALRQSREQLSAVFENARDGILIAEAASKRFVFANPMICRMLGYDREEMLTLDVTRIHPKEDLPRVFSEFEKQARRKHRLAADLPVLRKDGSVFWADINSFPIAFGGQTCLVGFFRDITARKRAEARVAQLSRLYATLSQINQTIVRVKTREELFPAICRAAKEHGRFLGAWIGLWDGAAGTLTIVAASGKGEEQLVGIMMDRRAPGFQGGLLERALTTGGLTIARDLRVETASALERDLAERDGVRGASVVPFHQAGGIAGVVAIGSGEVDYFADPELQGLVTEMATDISYALDAMDADAQRRRVEQAETRARAFADATIQSLPGIFYLFNDEGRFVRWNREFETVSGYTGEEIAALHPADFFAGEEKALIRQRIGIVFAEGASDAEAHFTAKDGARTPYYFTGRRVLLDGRPHVVGMGVDLTARKRAEAETRLLQTIALGVGAARNLDDALAIVLRLVCETAGWAMGEAWLPNREGTRLECYPVWHSAAPGLEEFRQASQDIRFAPGEGLPGRVWKSRQPEWFADLSVPTRFPRFKVAREAGLKAGLGVPVLAQGEVVLVLDFFLFEPTGEDVRRMKLIAAVAAEIGSLIERQRAEEAIRNSQELYWSLVENLPQSVFRKDRDGRFQFCNQRFCENVGRSSQEIIGRTDADFFPPELAGAYRRDDIRVMESGAVLDQVDEYVGANGRKAFVQVVKTPLRDASGKVVGVQGIFWDITEQRRAQESHARLATAVEQAAEAVWVTDADGTILYVNPAFERITGYGRAEAVGRNSRILKSGKHDAAFYRQVWAALAAGRPWSGRITNKRKDGALYEQDATFSPVRDAAGKIVNYVAVARDVTREAHLEDQLRQSQKMEAVGRLAGGIAHDFNNILTAILGYSSMTLAGLPVDDPLRRNVEEVQVAGERAAALTRQLLAFSRKQMLRPRVLDLNELVGRLSRMLCRLIGENVQLTTTFDPDLGRVRADPGQIEQVVTNLAVNARDAMPDGGAVTIRTANVDFDEAYARGHSEVTPGRYVMLAVSDTGTGMSDEVRARLFEPFFTTKELGKGVGLGLAMIYGIVRQSGGHITVYSEPGHGATFKVYLPRVEDTAEPSAPTQAPVKLPRGTETILLVEDEAQVRELARTMLERCGYTVLTAGNGPDALRLARQHPGDIHLLLTDVIMPGMNGRTLAPGLAALRPGIKVIFMSGYTDATIIRQDLMTDGSVFLQKPFSLEALAHKVREVLDATASKQGPHDPSPAAGG